ncbi:MAG: transporter [Planctomycetaceae bacterium]|nr:transporter [Planctomycetaceae bacterium]
MFLGLWIGRGKQNLSDYLLGGRDLPWWALLGSIVATETSTATFLSVPGIAFAVDGDITQGDMQFLQLPLGYIVGRCLVTVFLLPQYFRGELYTAYDVLERRFGGLTKQTASLVFLVTRNLGDGLRLFLTAIALKAALNLSMEVSIVVIGIATIVYTYAGGMKSVVWNDCLQFVVYMLGGVIALGVIVHLLPGGWSELSLFAAENEKFRLFDFSLNWTDSFTFWAGLVGGMFLTLGTHGTDQMMVQRYLSARGQRDAGKALVLSGVVVFGQMALFLLVGVALACFYNAFPPETAFEKGDHVFATFIVDYMPKGVCGVTLAAVFAAAMSTLSSSLNSSAASALNDLYVPHTARQLSPEQSVAISRHLTIVFGLIQIGIAIGAQYLVESVVSDALAIAGFAAGLLLGVFALGVVTRSVGQRAALVGMLGGLMVLAGVKFGTSIAWPWYAVIGSLTTFGIGFVVSWVLGEDERTETTQ